jgi:hypothetical protein
VIGRGVGALEGTSSIRVDDAHWPLALCTFRGAPSGDDVDSWLADMGALVARGKRFVMLADVATSRHDLSHLRRIGEWARENLDAFHATCAAVAVIVQSPWQRFLISAFYLVVTAPCPMSVFDDRPSAAAWLRERLKKEGLGVPAYLESST